jgi:succinate-acetate transporter protein
MFGFGTTVFIFGLAHSGLVTIGPLVLGTLLFYGGVCLVLAGVADWRQQNALGSVVGIAYGLFWLSLLGLRVLPASGFGQAPAPMVQTAYFFMWATFTSILCVASRSAGSGLQGTLFLLMVGLLLLAGADLFDLSAVRYLGGWLTLAAGLSAGRDGFRRGLAEAGRGESRPPQSARTP